MNCRLCEKNTQALDEKVLLGKYRVKYFHCQHCDLIQTETPYWLKEAYTDAISALDVGAAHRNLKSVDVIECIGRLLGKNFSGSGLDFGGGSGFLVRILRDRGWNFHWHDAYSKNIYAKGFESDLETKQDLITCFEVFEHFAENKKDLANLFKNSPKILITETLLHSAYQTGYPKDWWYYSLETGQHICFYSRKTMQHIAETHGYRVFTGDQYSVFIRQDLPLPAYKAFFLKKLLTRVPWMQRIGFLLNAFSPLPSFCNQDAAQLQQKASPITPPITTGLKLRSL